MNEQEFVNEAAKQIRTAVITKLISLEYIKYNKQLPSIDILNEQAKIIFEMPCCTKMLKKLFEDAHKMRDDRGMYNDSPATIADLEWCIKHRSIGYACIQKVSFGWLPYKQDKELRELPQCKPLLTFYGKQLKCGKNIIAPIEEEKQESEPAKIVNLIANHITKEA